MLKSPAKLEYNYGLPSPKDVYRFISMVFSDFDTGLFLLEALKIKGLRGDTVYCPVATLLKKRFEVEFRVDPYRKTIKYGYNFLDVSDYPRIYPAIEIAHLFDSGYFKELRITT